MFRKVNGLNKLEGAGGGNPSRFQLKEEAAHWKPIF